MKLTSGNIITLGGVLHVPDIRKNLISVSLLVQHGFKVVFESNKVVITKNGNFISKGYLRDGLFSLNVMDFDLNKIACYSFSTSSIANVECYNTWHGRLGHVNLNTIKRMMSLELILKSVINLKERCQVCVQAKQTKKPFKSIEKDTSLLQLIHSDTCDLNNVLTRGGKRYFITFIDNFSKYCYVCLISHKSELFDKFKIYTVRVENQLEKKIKILRSDRGGEYAPIEREEFCEHGIIHQWSPPYSPQSNGLAKRKNQILIDMINVMLASSGLPNNLWSVVLYSACHILHKVLYKISEKTPYEIWENQNPSLKYFEVWGCLAKVLIPITKKRKLRPKTVDCVFIGYDLYSVGYRFLVINSENSENKVEKLYFLKMYFL